MKNKLIIILLIAVLLLTGCKNKQEESLKKQEDLVKEEIKEISNINTKKIKENLEYVKNNYKDVSDKEKFDKVAYSTKYIQAIGIFEEKNELTILADNTTEYLKKQNKKTKEEVKKSLDKIKDKEDILIEEIYNSYMKNDVVKDIISRKKSLAQADLKDPSILTYDNVNNYFIYIDKNISKPFKNNEVIEYLVFYGLYLQEAKTNTLLTELGTKTISYLQSLDEKQLKEIEDIIKEINKNKKNIINSFITEVK